MPKRQPRKPTEQEKTELADALIAWKEKTLAEVQAKERATDLWDAEPFSQELYLIVDGTMFSRDQADLDWDDSQTLR